MSLVLVVVLALMGAAVFVRFYRGKKRFEDCLSKFPSPPGTPLLGHALIFKNDKNALTKYLDDFDGMAVFRVGPFHSFLAVADHELVELVCTGKHVEKSKIYKIFERRLGRGLFTLEGEPWRKTKKQVLPMFQSNVLEQMVGTFNSVTETLVANMKKNLGRQMDLYGHVYACTLDIFTGTFVGASLNALTSPNCDYIRCAHESQAIMQARISSTLKMYDWLYYFTREYRKERTVLPVLKDTTKSMLDSRIEAVTRQDVTEPAQMDLLLALRGKVLSDDDLRNILEGAIFAGQDTSASALSSTMYLLSQHLEVQRKVFEEQRSIFGEDGERDCTSKDLQDMTYLEMVIKENLRLYSPTELIAKELTEDIVFKGRTLPKGLMVVVMIQVIHRRAKYFPEPDRFVPERFSPENQKDVLPFSYLPFAAGRRICLGYKYAMMEMKTVLSKVLRRYELLPVDGFKLETVRRVIQKPNRNGVQVMLRERIY